eukprot:COSAG01_NODE_8001_length_2958_cov_1.785939_4_plen_56_part_00
MIGSGPIPVVELCLVMRQSQKRRRQQYPERRARQKKRLFMAIIWIIKIRRVWWQR